MTERMQSGDDLAQEIDAALHRLQADGAVTRGSLADTLRACKEQLGALRVVANTQTECVLDAEELARNLRAALLLANDAMNYMGDVLNGMDASQPEDVLRCEPAFVAVRGALAGGPVWKCKAREFGTAGGNDPQDCDWPLCGCDPYADKVIETLNEGGFHMVERSQKP